LAFGFADDAVDLGFDVAAPRRSAGENGGRTTSGRERTLRHV